MSTTTYSRPGRPTRGVGRIDDYEGSAIAKARAKAVLLAVAGDEPITEQLEALGVCRTRFARLRARALLALIEAMEPRSGGRQPRGREEGAQLAVTASEECSELHRRLHAAQVREEASAILACRAAD